MGRYKDKVMAASDDPASLTPADWRKIRKATLNGKNTVEVFKKDGKIIRRLWTSPPTDPEERVLPAGAQAPTALNALKEELGKPGVKSVEIVRRSNRMVLRRWESSHYNIDEHEDVTPD